MVSTSSDVWPSNKLSYSRSIADIGIGNIIWSTANIFLLMNYHRFYRKLLKQSFSFFIILFPPKRLVLIPLKSLILIPPKRLISIPPKRLIFPPKRLILPPKWLVSPPKKLIWSPKTIIRFFSPTWFTVISW